MFQQPDIMISMVKPISIFVDWKRHEWPAPSFCKGSWQATSGCQTQTWPARMRERGLGDSSSSSRFSPEPAGMRWRVESEARCELVSRGSLTTGAAPQPGQPTWPPPLNCRFEKLFPTTVIFVCPPEHHPRMVSYAAKPQQCGLFYLCSPTSITVTAAGGGVVQLRQSKPPVGWQACCSGPHNWLLSLL